MFSMNDHAILVLIRCIFKKGEFLMKMKERITRRKKKMRYKIQILQHQITKARKSLMNRLNGKKLKKLCGCFILMETALCGCNADNLSYEQLMSYQQKEINFYSLVENFYNEFI